MGRIEWDVKDCMQSRQDNIIAVKEEKRYNVTVTAPPATPPKQHAFPRDNADCRHPTLFAVLRFHPTFKELTKFGQNTCAGRCITSLLHNTQSM